MEETENITQTYAVKSGKNDICVDVLMFTFPFLLFFFFFYVFWDGGAQRARA